MKSVRLPPQGYGIAALVFLAIAPARGEDPPRPPVTLDDLVRIAIENHPQLGQSQLRIDASQGRVVQAGLYINPIVELRGDELNDRTARSGINSLPSVTQEIILGGKRKLNQEAAQREVDQSVLALQKQRYELAASVREAYFDLLVLKRRVDLNRELLELFEKSVAQTKKLYDAKEVSRLDLYSMEVEAEKIRVELESSEQELPSAMKQLAIAMGVRQLPWGRLVGDVEVDLPGYELERTLNYLLEIHPEIRSAQVGVERAQILLKRAQKEPIPNVQLNAIYVRQNQNKSNDFSLGISLPVPLWNRNQGNIMVAQSELSQAILEVERVRNDLSDRLAKSYRQFAAAVKKVDRYRNAIIPRARETFEISDAAYRGGQFDYLKLLESNRALVTANLEYVKALGEAWGAASRISGLTMEDRWPPVFEKKPATLTEPKSLR